MMLIIATLKWKQLGGETIRPGTVGVDGGGLSAASKSTQRDRAAHDGIVTAVTNLGFLDSCSSHLMLISKKTN
ncbi:hypothetical protein Y032_0023g707 [Ancylostoma ceylanicum]|uniref:Uncharacterized protein n=1 Tax=Ancylostoma ceylanicum TaxID=53326 RepID=A0A016UYB1_9BILA|nr:hypothetical protein Y032_0023g707 [Ancylostoma ceylanicum]